MAATQRGTKTGFKEDTFAETGGLTHRNHAIWVVFVRQAVYLFFCVFWPFATQVGERHR